MAIIRRIDNVPEQISERDKEVHDSASLGATTLLTFPTYNSSARMIMFSNHLTQRVTLNTTQFPKVFTNWENILGALGSYNVDAEHNYKVIYVIPKFPNIITANKTQTVLFIVQNLDDGEYDILERHDVENMTEKYGFQYDNSGIDSYHEGDIIEKGAHLTRPTSFDKFDNYGFGRNIKFMYGINQDTTEDAIMISESLASAAGSLESTEVEEVKISLNDDEFLGNYYGNDDEYKSFPNIGESVKNKILCVKKRIVNSQILYDLKSSNCKKILADDTPYYIDGIVTDVEIYFNKPYEELNRASFNYQVNEYIDMIHEFYEKIKDITDELIDSGATCSQNILSWNNRVNEMLNPDIKLKDDVGSAFSNIVMYFTIKRSVGLSVGQKLTGKQTRNCRIYIVIYKLGLV